jgi:phosphopantothenoylcysteine decarboxylase/phosphopantothenate--cysteine ligase
MRCLVTAGPTFEPLDEVRRLTNFSTGQLGTLLAQHLATRGHETLLLRGFYSTFQISDPGLQLHEFTTTSSLWELFQAQARNFRVDAIFHAAAVSDYGFGKIWKKSATGELAPAQERKVSTRHSESLLVELVPTPKILRQLRGLFPNAFIAGWKYEVDGRRESVLEKCRKQLREAHTDVAVANGPAYGTGFGLVSESFQHCEGRTELISNLAAMLEKRKTS